MLWSAEQLLEMEAELKERSRQVKLLNGYLSTSSLCNPSAIVVHGPPATGKSYTIRHFLEKSPIKYSWVSCEQYITPRILLQKALTKICDETGFHPEYEKESLDLSVENFTVFGSTLEQLFRENNYQDPHILVLDRIDRSFEDPSDLLTCFSRIHELCGLYNLTTIFIINSLEPRALVAISVPHVWFPRYTKEEAIKILAGKFHSEVKPVDGMTSLVVPFLSLVCDSLGSYTGTDLRLLRQAALRLWPVFIKPIENGQLKSNQVVPLLRASETYFASEFAIEDRLVNQDQTSGTPSEVSEDLPIQSKYLLCAAYLASYNPPQFDIRFFSKAKEARAKRRDTSRRKALKINPRSLAAPAFDLERMMAIFHSIYDHEQYSTNIDIGVQIASLTTLKLIVRTADPLDSRTKWKINVGWTLIEKLAEEIGLELAEYMLE